MRLPVPLILAVVSLLHGGVHGCVTCCGPFPASLRDCKFAPILGDFYCELCYTHAHASSCYAGTCVRGKTCMSFAEDDDWDGCGATDHCVLNQTDVPGSKIPVKACLPRGWDGDLSNCPDMPAPPPAPQPTPTPTPTPPPPQPPPPPTPDPCQTGDCKQDNCCTNNVTECCTGKSHKDANGCGVGGHRCGCKADGACIGGDPSGCCSDKWHHTGACIGSGGKRCGCLKDGSCIAVLSGATKSDCCSGESHKSAKCFASAGFTCGVKPSRILGLWDNFDDDDDNDSKDDDFATPPTQLYKGYLVWANTRRRGTYKTM